MRKYGPSSTHKRLIQELVDQGYCTKDFPDSITAAFSGISKHRYKRKCKCEETAEELCDRCQWYEVKNDLFAHHPQKFLVPDAYKIIPDKKILIVAEVEVTHPMPMGKYTNLFWALDEDEWEVIVECYGRRGEKTVIPYNELAFPFTCEEWETDKHNRMPVI